METIASAVLNGWWQGIVLTLGVWLVLRDLPRVSASSRVAIWQVVLVTVALLPALQNVSWRSLPLGRQEPAPVVVSQGSPVETAGTVERVEPVQESATARPLVEINGPEAAEVLAVAVVSLALLQLLWLGVGYWRVRRLKAKSWASGLEAPGGWGRGCEVRVSGRIGMPMAAGFQRPVILLPQGLAEQLSEEEREQVLLHEAGHLERRDDWFGLAERLLRALFFFQPAMWFIGRQIEREREMACDDWVTEKAGGVKVYARALTRVAELNSGLGRPMLTMGAGRRKEIQKRIAAILDAARNRTPRVSEAAVAVAMCVLGLVVLEGAPWGHVFGFSRHNHRMVETGENFRREVRWKGDLRFRQDGKDVESMAAGGEMVVEVEREGRTRRVEVRGGEYGKLTREYFRDGQRAAYGEEAERFLAKELQPHVRGMMLDVPGMTKAMLAEYGVEGTLRELRQVHNEEARRRYLVEMLGTLRAAEVPWRRVAQVAGELRSEHEIREFLDEAERYFEAAGQVGLLLEPVLGMQNDEAKGAALLRLLRLEGRKNAEVARGVFRAAANLQSADVKKELWQEAADWALAKGELKAAVLEMVASIEEESVRAELWKSWLTKRSGEATVVEQLGRLHSDEAKGELLLAVAEQYRETAELRGAFFAALGMVQSEQKRGMVLEALLGHKGLAAETKEQIGRAARRLVDAEARAAVEAAMRG